MILSFYKFVALQNLPTIKTNLQKKCLQLKLNGTILIANEGINANLEGEPKKLQDFCKFIDMFNFFHNIEFNFSPNKPNSAFKKLKVKIKKEIITAKIKDLNLAEGSGTYLTSKDWDQLLADEDKILIDTRNHYEFALGTFKGAINPKIQNFSELKNWLDVYLKTAPKEKKIAMFCTGGIRCEKSTAYLKQQGFKNVYHLKGGIISYLKNTSNPENWQGKCFVFDDRLCV